MRSSSLYRAGLLVLPVCLQLMTSPGEAQPADPENAGAPSAAFDAKAYRESQKLARRREREALAAARPSYYRRRRALGFVAIGVGTAVTATGLLTAVWHALAEGLPHSGGESPLSTGEKRLIGCSLGIGLPVLGVGIWAVRSPVLEMQQMRLSVAPRMGTQGELALVAKLSL